MIYDLSVPEIELLYACDHPVAVCDCREVLDFVELSNERFCPYCSGDLLYSLQDHLEAVHQIPNLSEIEDF